MASAAHGHCSRRANRSAPGKALANIPSQTTAGRNLEAKAVDERVQANWLKVKLALEAAGKTNCHMYMRACMAVKTGRDPGHPFAR